MSHDELPMRAETASAYLDGEIDADGRAAAEADPTTMALVESLRVLRTAVSDVEPAAVSSRTAAIAAALAEYDTRRNDEVAPAPVRQPALLVRRRERIYRFAFSAAAAAIVLVVAVAALMNGGGGDEKSSSATEAVAPALAPADTQRKVGDAATAPAATEAPSILATEAAGVPEINNPEALRQYAAATNAMDATAEAPAPGATPSTTVAAAETMPPPASAAPSAGGSLPCLSANDSFLGDITVLGLPAFAVRELSTGQIKAIAADDCRLLFSVSP